MIKKVFFNGLADIMTVGVGLLSSVVLTRVLGPQQWGEYSQILWLIGFAATFLSFGLNYTSMRFLGLLSEKTKPSEIKGLIIWLIGVQLLVSSIGCIIIFVFAPQITYALGWYLHPDMIRLAALALFSFTIIQLAISMLRGLQEFRKLSVLAFITSTFQLITISIVFVHPSIFVLILATAISQLVLLPWIVMNIWQRGGSHAVKWWQPPQKWRALVRYSSIVFLAMLADQIIWQRSEIFFLAQLSDTRQSGYYSLAYTLTLLALGTLPTALTGTFTPIFSAQSEAASSRITLAHSYRQAFSFLNLILLPAAVGLFIVSPQVVSLLYGDAYKEVIPVLRILIFSSAISIYARPSASLIHALNKPQMLLFGNLLAIPVDVFIAWKLVPEWGAQGAALANAIAQLIGAGFAIGYTIRAIGFQYDTQSIIKSFISAGACGMSAWAVNQVVGFSSFGLVLTVAIGASIYILALFRLGDQPTHQAIKWVRLRTQGYLSSVGRS